MSISCMAISVSLRPRMEISLYLTSILHQLAVQKYGLSIVIKKAHKNDSAVRFYTRNQFALFHDILISLLVKWIHREPLLDYLKTKCDIAQIYKFIIGTLRSGVKCCSGKTSTSLHRYSLFHSTVNMF